MAKAVDIARSNLQNLTNTQTRIRVQRSIQNAKENLLQLDEDANFPKIGLLVDRVDIKNITLKMGLWSVTRQKKQLLISIAFLGVQYFLKRRECSKFCVSLI